MTTRTVQDILDKIAYRNHIMEHYRVMAWASNKDQFREALDLIHEDDPEVLSLIVKYLTTGSAPAKEAIDIHVGEVLANTITARFNVGWHRKDNWRDACPSAWSPVFASALKMRWNALNVMEESGCYHEDTEEYLLWVSSTERLMHLAGEEDEPKGEAYWRGLGAATLVQIINSSEIFYTDADRIEQLQGFVELAGSTPHLKPLMKIAVERDLIDADMLRDLMEDRDAILTAVGEGVL